MESMFTLPDRADFVVDISEFSSSFFNVYKRNEEKENFFRFLSAVVSRHNLTLGGRIENQTKIT